jgi:hypothetical protein
MQKLLIGLGFLILATLAYLAFGGGSKEPDSYSEEGESEQSEASDTSSADKRKAKEFVPPRRMRSRSSLSDDELADPNLRKMNRMGGGEDFRSNKGNRLATSEVSSEVDTSEREQQHAEVVARRSRQWISDSDKDSDGLLSPSEAELGGANLRRVLSDFDAADTNGDGVVNLEELKIATALHRKRRLERRRGR